MQILNIKQSWNDIYQFDISIMYKDNSGYMQIIHNDLNNSMQSILFLNYFSPTSPKTMSLLQRSGFSTRKPKS